MTEEHVFSPHYLNILATIYAKSPHVMTYHWTGPDQDKTDDQNIERFLWLWTTVCDDLWRDYSGDPDTLIMAPEDVPLFYSPTPPATKHSIVRIVNTVTGNEVKVLSIPGLRQGTQFLLTMDPKNWLPADDLGFPILVPYFPAAVIYYPIPETKPVFTSPGYETIVNDS